MVRQHKQHLLRSERRRRCGLDPRCFYVFLVSGGHTYLIFSKLVAIYSKAGQAGISSARTLSTSPWNRPLLFGVWAKPGPHLFFSPASICGRSKSAYNSQLRSASALISGPWLSAVLDIGRITERSPCFTPIGAVSLIGDKFLSEKIWGHSIEGRASTLTGPDSFLRLHSLNPSVPP